MTTDMVEMTLGLLQQIRDRDAQIVTLRQIVSVAVEVLADRDRELSTARARLNAMRDELRWFMTGVRQSDDVEDSAA